MGYVANTPLPELAGKRLGDFRKKMASVGLKTGAELGRLSGMAALEFMRDRISPLAGKSYTVTYIVSDTDSINVKVAEKSLPDSAVILSANFSHYVESNSEIFLGRYAPVIASVIASYAGMSLVASVGQQAVAGKVDSRSLAGAVVGTSAVAAYDVATTGKVTLGQVGSLAGSASSLLGGINMDSYDTAFDPFQFQDNASVSAWTDAQNVSYGFNAQPNYSDTLMSSVDSVSEAGAYDFGPVAEVGYFGQGATSDVTTNTFGTQFLAGGADNEALYSNEGHNYPALAAGSASSWSQQAQETLGVISAGAKAIGSIAGVYGAVTTRQTVKPPNSGAPRSSTRSQNESANVRPGSAFGQLFSTGGPDNSGNQNKWLLVGGVVLIGAALLIK